MSELIAGLSPRLKNTPALLLGQMVTASLTAAVLVRSALTLRAESAATASSVLSAEPVFRLGFVANLIGAAFYGLLTLVLHYAMAPAKLSLSLLAAYLTLLRRAVSEAAILVHFAPALFHEGVHALTYLVVLP